MFISSPSVPGADTFVHALVMRSLDKSRFAVHAACTAGRPGARTAAFTDLATIPGLAIRPSDFGPSLSGLSSIQKLTHATSVVPMLADMASLVRYIRHHQIQIVHSTDRPRDALSCVLLGKLTGARSVVHVHVKCSEWTSRPVRWAMTHADAVVGVSRFVAQSLVEHGSSPERTHVILNAIDVDAWDFLADRAPIRREFSVPDKAPLVVSVARLFHWKGQANLVRAAALVRHRLPDLRLLIVGEDDRQVMLESFAGELRTLIRDLRLEGTVTLTGKRSDVPSLLAACDLFALPSFEEPFGLVFLEAMAMKRPVVALNNGGTPEVVAHEQNGLLSPPGDVDALATNLLRLLQDPERRAAMGEHGRRHVESGFTPRDLARQTERVYSALLR